MICNQHFTSFAIKLENKRGIELSLEFLLNLDSGLVQRFRFVAGNVDCSEEDDGHQDCAESRVSRMHAPTDSTGELVRLSSVI